MEKKIAIYIWLILCTGCNGGQRKQNVLSEDKMVDIIVDIHLTEGFVQSLSIPYDSSKKLYPVLEKEVFEKHAVSDSAYLSSLQYYLRDAAKMEHLYQRAIDSLVVKEKNALQ